MRRSFLASCCLVLLTACVPPAVAPPAATRSEPSVLVAPTTAPTAPASPAVAPTRVPAAAPTAGVSTGTAAPASGPTVVAVPVGRGERLFALEDPNRPRMAVIDAATGTRVRELPHGVVAPDWSVVYAVEHGRDTASKAEWTVARAVDVETGTTLRESAKLNGRYDVPYVNIYGQTGGLSPDGAWLALQVQPTEAEYWAAERDGEWTSRFVVLDTAFQQAPRSIQVDGEMRYDALADDGVSLYLTEYLPAGAPTHEVVRRWDLASGTLDPHPVVMKGEEPGEQIGGMRLAAIPSPDGKWLYSLYTQEGHGPFIHALSLQDRVAVCIDLPKGESMDFEKQLLWSMTMTADGRTLYAVNPAVRAAATISTGELSVSRSVSLPARVASAAPLQRVADWLVPVAEAKRLLQNGAVLSGDGETLYAIDEHGLLALDTATLSVQGRYLESWTFDSLAASPDGERLYAVSVDQAKLVQIDPTSGAVQREVAGARAPWGILRVAEGS